MAPYFPEGAWIRLGRQTLDSLQEFKRRHALASPDAALAQLLHAKVGDPLAIEVTGSGLPAVQLPLAGLTTDTLGNLVFTRTTTIRAALGPNPGLAAGN